MSRDFELVLVRHAEAQPYSPEGDAGRRLTPEGHDAARVVAQAFVAQEWTWSHALVSPFERAMQTCDHVIEALSPVFERIYEQALPAPEVTELATPFGDVEALAHLIAARGFGLHSPAPRVVVFGHNPTLEALASLLLAGNGDAQPVRLGTACALHLLVDAPSPIDEVLAPQDAPPLPTALLLGRYDQERLRALVQS